MTVHEVRQGDVAFPASLAEYLSRKARHELALNLYNGLVEDIRIERNFRRRDGKSVPRTLNASRVMAKILGVTLRTVQRWRRGGFQSCNFNAEKLIRESLKICPERAEEILEEDMEIHRHFFELLINEMRQGDVAFPKPVEVVA